MDPDSPDLLQPQALSAYGGGWSAQLRARVERIAGRSTLAGVAHHGPLRLQKALWPEGPDPVHLIVLHPPGGIAAGDTLALELAVGASAHALLTTPGAGHWYRADAPARQGVRLSVGPGATLEWLPQEVIVHDGAQALSGVRMELAAGAAAIGLDVSVFGRRDCGERFASGQMQQSLEIELEGRLLLEDHAQVTGGELEAISVLGPHHVSGLLWAVPSQPLPSELAERVEAAMTSAGAALCGASALEPRLLLARAVDSSPERVRAALTQAWRVLRPLLLGREAVLPRIWMT